MSRPVCSECLCVIDETGCGCVQPIEPFTNHEQGEMNANELADELKQHLKTLKYETTESIAVATGLYTECEIRLRQQQAEIEALKAKLQLHEAMDNQCASLMQQFRKAHEK